MGAADTWINGQYLVYLQQVQYTASTEHGFEQTQHFMSHLSTSAHFSQNGKHKEQSWNKYGGGGQNQKPQQNNPLN